MKTLINILSRTIYKIIFLISIFLFFSYKYSFANETYQFEINGNQNTDQEVILSIIDKIPDDLSEEYSNYLLNELNKSGLFKDINIKIENNRY